VFLAIAILTAVLLLITFVIGVGLAIGVTAALAFVVLTTWWLVPMKLRRRLED